MSRLTINAICALTRVGQNSSVFSQISKNSLIYSQVRGSKHWNPKWKKLRAQKVIKVKLPDYENDDDSDLSNEKMRSKLKEAGLQPSMPWMEKPIFISCTGSIFEEYVPPEGDGKYSTITGAGAKQKMEFMTKKGKSYLAVKKIRRFDDDFSIGEFEEVAHDIYIKAHEAIAKKDHEGLRMYVTERAFPEVVHNTDNKTIHWKFIESLAPARVVHARCTDVVTKENVFAQLTVRFHTQQTLAVYDRFGRLMHGSEILKKDVLEYVVFEKHCANVYGIWRIHGKIIPTWMPEREYAERTYIEKPVVTNVLEEPPKKEVSVAEVDKSASSPEQPAAV